MKWLVVALLWGVALLNYLDRQVIYSLFPLLERDLHATSLELGLIGTVFLVSYGLLSPVAGYMADRAGRLRVILFSLVVWSLATWMTRRVGNVPELLVSRAVMGFSEAFYLPAALALIADWHGPGTRSIATGLHQTGLYTGIVLGGSWGGWMGEHVGWRPVFQILGIVGILYFIVLSFALRGKGTPYSASPLFASWNQVLRTRAFLRLMLAFTAMSVALWFVNTWLPLFLYERFQMTLVEAGFSATFYMQAASYAGVLAGGRIADRWSARNPNARVRTQIAGLLLAAPFLVLLGAAGTKPILIAALIMFGFGRGVFDCNTMPVVRDLLPAQLSGTAYGLLNTAGCLAGGLTTALAGWMRAQVGLAAAFPIAAAILVLGALALPVGRSAAASSGGAGSCV